MQICKLPALLIAAALSLAAGGSALAQIEATGKTQDESVGWTKSFVDSSLIELRCEVPNLRPRLTYLRRSTAPNPTGLIGSFLGGRDNVMKQESVVHPIWGNGTRYKSGMVITVLSKEKIGDRVDKEVSLSKISDVEVVPAFLDTYGVGFLYLNNIPHTAVYATDVQIERSDKARVSYHTVYNESEGEASASRVIEEMVGAVKCPAGFQLATDKLIQTFGERLFAYRVHPEYLTTYNVYEGAGDQRKIVREGKIAVKVNDVYVHVLLDGEKLLCGMEYFWDNGLKAEGTPQECIWASDAVMKSREWLVKQFKGAPPQMVVSDLQLGFVQDRKDGTRLVPAWLFNAWYTADDKKSAVQSGLGGDVVRVPLPFAVNALTGDVFKL